jgi:hypothetical protein
MTPHYSSQVWEFLAKYWKIMVIFYQAFILQLRGVSLGPARYFFLFRKISADYRVTLFEITNGLFVSPFPYML